MWHTFTNLENRKKTCEKQNTILAILCDLFGMVKWPLQRLSDLQLGDKKSTLNHLDCQVKKIQTSSLRAAFSMVPFSMVQWWPSVLLHMYDMFLESGSKPAFSLSFLSCLKKTRHVSSLTFSCRPTIQPPPTTPLDLLPKDLLSKLLHGVQTAYGPTRVGLLDPDHQMVPGMSKGITPWHPNKLSLKQPWNNNVGCKRWNDKATDLTRESWTSLLDIIGIHRIHACHIYLMNGWLLMQAS